MARATAATSRPGCKDILAEHGLAEVCDGEVVLMTMPRMLGYVFNPVSFWFCRDRAGALRAVLCEVNNTFGESHCYLVHHDDRRADRARTTGSTAARSSTSRPSCRSRAAIASASASTTERAHVDVNYHDAEGLMLATSVGGRREPLADRTRAAPLPRQPDHDPGRRRPDPLAGLATLAEAGEILSQACTAAGARDPLT